MIGVEPAAGDDVRQSLAAGERITIPVPVTIADGQQTQSPGELTFAVIRELVDEIALVTDAEIVDAMRFYFERMKVVAEPSGACALAAVLSGAGRDRRRTGRCGVVGRQRGRRPVRCARQPSGGLRGVGWPRPPSCETSRGKNREIVQSLTTRALRARPGVISR